MLGAGWQWLSRSLVGAGADRATACSASLAAGGRRLLLLLMLPLPPLC